MHGFFCFGGSFSQGDRIFLGSVAFVCITLKILDGFIPSNILKFECKRNIYIYKFDSSARREISRWREISRLARKVSPRRENFSPGQNFFLPGVTFLVKAKLFSPGERFLARREISRRADEPNYIVISP